MCFIDNPAPTFYIKCKHTVNQPEEPTLRMCFTAHQRSPPSWCPDPPKRTSKGSSKNRLFLCPDCVIKGGSKKDDSRNDGADDGADAGAGAGAGSVPKSAIQVSG